MHLAESSRKSYGFSPCYGTATVPWWLSIITPASLAPRTSFVRTGAARILVSARSLIEGFDVPLLMWESWLPPRVRSRQRLPDLGQIFAKTGEDRAAVLHSLHVGHLDEMIYEAGLDCDYRSGKAISVLSGSDTAGFEPLEGRRPSSKPHGRRDWLRVLSEGAGTILAPTKGQFSSILKTTSRDFSERVASNPGRSRPDPTGPGSFGRFSVTCCVFDSAGEGASFSGILAEPFRYRHHGDTIRRALNCWSTRGGGYHAEDP